ncbi:TetR/AcrR family transcriptional regulator [Nonomuraea basaltis]|uniref:TetR/AcrR family transcriptional regulator n=1 Tax=Nonomuraea basaltis TaxID=2495887 RepID=UPI00110C6303|nr:TetR/AcrR family transcriptional regulator [Nonomuraea basaltis]TMR97724.1 TetR/AcrR family transcriptional regulator [Nonomuraea basaltis]
MRADAVRNRRLLLEAAAAELAEHGTEVSIARIAARAGVGKGTVFRHFATKEQLVTAIFGDQLDRLAARGENLLGHADSGQALLEFMAGAVELQVADRSFCQAVTVDLRRDPQLRAASDRLVAAAESLTARARADGAARDDITGHDIVLLINAVAQATAPLGDAVPGLWRRYLGLIFDGLRPMAARPLPVPAPGSLAPP